MQQSMIPGVSMGMLGTRISQTWENSMQEISQQEWVRYRHFD